MLRFDSVDDSLVKDLSQCRCVSIGRCAKSLCWRAGTVLADSQADTIHTPLSTDSCSTLGAATGTGLRSFAPHFFTCALNALNIEMHLSIELHVHNGTTGLSRLSNSHSPPRRMLAAHKTLPSQGEITEALRLFGRRQVTSCCIVSTA